MVYIVETNFRLKNLIKKHGYKQQCEISIKFFLSKYCSNNTQYVIVLKVLCSFYENFLNGPYC
jgi:hypothetical protein